MSIHAVNVRNQFKGLQEGVAHGCSEWDCEDHVVGLVDRLQSCEANAEEHGRGFLFCTEKKIVCSLA